MSFTPCNLNINKNMLYINIFNALTTLCDWYAMHGELFLTIEEKKNKSFKRKNY